MSLLELAIVLALLVVLAGIIVPAIGPRLDRSREREGLSRLQSAVAIAQNKARASGHPLRLVVTADEPQVVMAQPLSLATPEDAEAEPAPDEREVQTRGEYLASLPARCRVVASKETDNRGEPSAGDRADKPEAVVLGWALQDGTFEPAHACTLETDRGTVTLRFDAWTGAVTAEPVTSGDDAQPIASLGGGS
ncbi:MAG: hypothetical protein DHS20C14_12750 [Phycisphaeraceae bacterium]|nr:MAG: hypothetical protein DHS20C14_12750 [Phycisphaeraceae bacterium]